MNKVTIILTKPRHNKSLNTYYILVAYRTIHGGTGTATLEYRTKDECLAVLVGDMLNI